MLEKRFRNGHIQYNTNAHIGPIFQYGTKVEPVRVKPIAHGEAIYSLILSFGRRKLRSPIGYSAYVGDRRALLCNTT